MLFIINETILDNIKNIDMLILCNPNNPIGSILPNYLIEQIIEKCGKENVILLIDECFIEFLPNWNEISQKKNAALSQNIVVIDAFTKTYALPGFRLGFCITGNRSILLKMKQWGQDFSVSIPAQVAGICALADKINICDTRR